jgi:trans-aconitate 2-methyltransferase
MRPGGVNTNAAHGRRQDESMSDWDASRYHRISGPQFDWGQRVIARLRPLAGERILDLGCGTGRLTTEIVSAVDGGRVVGLDRSGAMITVARASADAGRLRHIAYVQGDGAALPFAGAFDAVFSAATLHWIHDHQSVFEGVRAALKPGGRFVAQCGGAGNLQRLLVRAGAIMASPPYEPFFRDWHDPWHFADPQATARRLHAAGFVDVETSLQEAPVALGHHDAFAEFIGVVCIRHHLDRLPVALRDPFTRELTDTFRRDTPPFELDYQRLNIGARKPPA